MLREVLVGVPRPGSALALASLFALVAVGACAGGDPGGRRPPGGGASGGSDGSGGTGATPGGGFGGGGGGSPGQGGASGSPGGGAGGAAGAGGTGGQAGAGPARDGGPAGGGGGSPGVDAGAGTPALSVSFDPPGGAFVGMQQVRLVASVAGAVIRYTRDGSLPTAASPVYSAPLALTESTIVRAIAERPGTGTSLAAAAVYLRASPEVAAFDSNLPIVVLHTHASGVLEHLRRPDKTYAPPVPGSVTVIEPPAGGRARLVGPATFTSRVGVRVRGNSSRKFLQRSFAFELRHPWDDTDDDKPMMGLPSDADWALIAPSRVDRALVRTAVAFTLSNDIGRYAPRVRMVEVFTVETGANGAITNPTYQGVYTLTEKIKASKNRIKVSDFDPMATTEPLVSGGYVFRIDHGDANFIVNNICHCVFDEMPMLPFQVVEPDWDRLAPPAQMTVSNYLRTYMQDFADAALARDFKNPRTGKRYSEYIDVPSFIDHNLLNALFKNVDGLRLSAYFHKERGGPVVAGPIWDFDRSSGTMFDDDYGRRTEEAREWARLDATHPLMESFWARLFADPTFKTAYNARWRELAAGPFSLARVNALIDRFVAEVAPVQARHFARWPEYAPAGGSHAADVKIMKDWFAARIPWLTTQLR